MSLAETSSTHVARLNFFSTIRVVESSEIKRCQVHKAKEAPHKAGVLKKSVVGKTLATSNNVSRKTRRAMLLH